MVLDVFQMRQPCKFGCDTDTGRLVPVNGQNVVRCAVCNRAQYNAPKTETGEKARSECEECNSGQGNEPMSLRLAVAILKARKSWAEANR
jgi:hypothetical protein